MPLDIGGLGASTLASLNRSNVEVDCPVFLPSLSDFYLGSHDCYGTKCIHESILQGSDSLLHLKLGIIAAFHFLADVVSLFKSEVLYSSKFSIDLVQALA